MEKNVIIKLDAHYLETMGKDRFDLLHRHGRMTNFDAFTRQYEYVVTKAYYKLFHEK